MLTWLLAGWKIRICLAIYTASEEGRVFVLSADPKLEILASNDIGEPITSKASIS